MTLNDYLTTLGFEQQSISQFTSLFSDVSYQAGDTILRMGENTGYMCLILRGLVRGYYLDEDGNEITKCFSKEGEWCCSYNYFSEDPSPYYIEALENCQLARVSTEQLKKLIAEYPKVREAHDKLFREAFFQVEEKGSSFQKMTAKERYVEFVRKNPELVKRVKQEYLASYLGITPSSLSRIRREL